MRWRLGGALLIFFAFALPAVAETVFLVDSPFDQMGIQPTRIYDLDPATGTLTLKADLGNTFTPVLGLAAASGTEFYAIGSDNSVETPCFACVLLHIVVTPPSTTPQVTAIGHVRAGGEEVSAFTQLAFRGNGELYGVGEDHDVLYLIDPETASAMVIGPLTVDLGGGCTATPLDVTGGDLAFDALDRLWMWNNNLPRKGLWEVNPANGCAIQRSSCASSRNMSGLTVADHTSPSPLFRAPSPNDERLYRVVPGACPVNNESTSVLLRLNGVQFNHDRGDADSPYCLSDLACADSDACTTDHCSPGGCQYDPVSCDDGNACTDETCDPQTGCVTLPHLCDDGDACTADSCDPATGCQASPISCDDGNACTDDACDPASGCTHVPHVCDDGNACTADSCDPATGCQTAPISCDDGNACTDDACDPVSGCTHVPHVCDDGNACTTDSCDPVTGCQTASISCDDGNACTDDACDPVSGCTHVPHVCDDGNACTADSCDPATGCQTAPISCDDGNACTDDACDPASGCTHVPHVCDDGNACTTDSCDPATGCQTSPIFCDDGNACTANVCDPDTGCTFPSISDTCDDGNACTEDACDPQSGCQHVPHPCDDGNACTADSCNPASGCQTSPISCDDGNACTTDSCDPATGCQTTPLFCDDGNACTANVCDPASGCTYLPAAGSCDDGDPCTENDACTAGTCSGSPVAVAEVPSLSVSRQTQGNTRIAWAAVSGSGLTYDLVSGSISELANPDAIPTATCIGNGLGLSVYDPQSDPAPGEGLYYVVRAASTCGRGPYGQTTGGNPRRPGNDCP